jgi:putative transposase
VERRIAPSARIEEAIEAALLDGVAEPDRISQLGRLATQLIIQRAVEDEVSAFLGRARYERTPDARGSRNGHRSRRVQTAEGEIVIAMPQVRDSLTGFVSSVIPDVRGVVRTRPLEALVIGAYVRGLSDRDIESLAREAGLGQLSRTTVSTICRELRDRYRAFRARSLAEVRLLALFTDAIYLPVRPDGPKEGVLVAWGFTLDGERVLLDVCLGQRERLEDWLDLGRALVARGLPDPLLVVADGAPGLVRAIGELWPEADRQRCTVHRLRNVLAKLPERPGLHERVRQRGRPGRGRAGPAGAGGLPRAGVPQCRGLPGRGPVRAHGPPRLPSAPQEEAAVDEPARALARGGPPTDEGHRPLPRRVQLPDARLGGHGPRHRGRQGARARQP